MSSPKGTWKPGRPGVAPRSSSYRRQIVDELIEWDNQRKRKMGIKNLHAVVHAQHAVSGMRVEFHFECVTYEDVTGFANGISNAGYRAITQTSKPNIVGQKGTVESVTKKPDGKNGFDVVIKLDAGGEQKLTAFKATEYRKGDRVQIEKNDKGFYEGVILTDENDEKTTDIPF